MDNAKEISLILDQISNRGGRRTADIEEEKVKLVVFTLRGELFAFKGSEVKEILPGQNIYYVPGAPDYITGLINNRGDVESVMDINGLLGLPGSVRGPQSRIILACGAGVRSGILVDSVLDVVDLPASAIKPPISTLDGKKKEFVTGEAAHDGRNVTMLGAGAIFEKMK